MEMVGISDHQEKTMNKPQWDFLFEFMRWTAVIVIITAFFLTAYYSVISNDATKFKTNCANQNKTYFYFKQGWMVFEYCGFIDLKDIKAIYNNEVTP